MKTKIVQRPLRQDDLVTLVTESGDEVTVSYRGTVGAKKACVVYLATGWQSIVEKSMLKAQEVELPVCAFCNSVIPEDETYYMTLGNKEAVCDGCAWDHQEVLNYD